MNSRQEGGWGGLARCVHSCYADKLAEPGRFVKAGGFFHPQLSSSEDMEAEDTVGWLCMQKEGSGGACLSVNSLVQTRCSETSINAFA